MVNVTLTAVSDPLRDLAFSYAPADRRAGLKALFALDAALGHVLRTTREPMVGQIRLAWWREALTALDAAPPPGEPVLQALAAEVLPRGVTGMDLAQLADGWEPLLGTIDAAAVDAHAAWRGAHLFGLAGDLLGVPETGRLRDAGSFWALADLSSHLSDSESAQLVRARFVGLSAGRWSRAARPLAALALIAAREASGTVGVSTVFRLFRLRVTGR